MGGQEIGEKERDSQLENRRERVREEVADPYGNRIKTLGKRNFSSGEREGTGFDSFGAFGNPPKKSRNAVQRHGDFPRGSPRCAVLLDPLARIAALAKVIGRLRGIIIHDKYRNAKARINVTTLG